MTYLGRLWLTSKSKRQGVQGCEIGDRTIWESCNAIALAASHFCKFIIRSAGIFLRLDIKKQTRYSHYFSVNGYGF